jgi:hypothetical protein
MDKKEGPDKWLRAFESDITSDSASNPNEEDNQKTNAFLDLGPNKSMDIKSQMKEPFKSAIYKLYDLNIAASEVKEIMEGTKDKVDNNVIVEFTVKSEILTAREETYNFEIKKTIRISRD